MSESPMVQEEFRQQVYALVKVIPQGRVATYGQLAFLAGHPRHPRLVGKFLREAPSKLKLPCHRVVNAAGRCTPGWPEQAALLRRENVAFRPNGNVDLDRCFWCCFEE